MAFDQFVIYLALAFFAGYLGLRWAKFSKTKKLLPQLLADGAVIVDVRTPEEFRTGAHPRSINIPIARFESGIDKLDPHKTIVVCCASGARSGLAVGLLKKKGFEKVINAGPWTNTL